ncbi:MAG: hydroxymethylglutaryl-CoA lyase [Acetivibrionales bacterium]|jgi:hydroxymethylglutaryl-CoA lyase
MKKYIGFIEIGPRDGFQNIKDFIPTELKLEIIDKIVSAGVKKIQATSFVSPKAIPQMSDSIKVMEACQNRYKDVCFSALTPNYRGVEIAAGMGVKEVNFVISVSELHNKANVNRSIEESFNQLKKAVEDFPDVSIVLDAATVFGCPFNSEITYAMVEDFVGRAVNMGIQKICLCDTNGIAIPNQVRAYVMDLKKSFPHAEFIIHIHDTRNMGVVNTLAAIESGIDAFQSTLGGLGGCPFAPGATGNTSSEDLIYMLDKMGYDTGVDPSEMIAAAKYLNKNVKGNYSGHQIHIK